MRKFLLVLIVIASIYGCSKQEGNTHISGQIKGLNKGQLVLQKVDDTTLVSLDSLRIYESPEFSFVLDLGEPEVLYLALKFDDSITQTRYLPFFAEPGTLNIKTSLKGFGYDQSITGSENQTTWDEFKLLQGRYNDRQLELIQAELTASQNNKRSEAERIQMQREKLLRARYLATVNFAKNHKDMPIAPYLMLAEIPDVNLKYHDTIYKLLSPKIKNSKYGKALELFMNQQKDSLL
jgi:hypothetical protein